MLLKLIAKKDAFIRSEEGATAIEYGLIAAGIAVAISVVVFTLGGDISAMFQSTADTISAAGPQ